MKRKCPLFLLAAVCLALAGCTAVEEAPSPNQIENAEWTMTTIQDAVGGAVVYSSDPQTDAKPLNLTCRAENGTLTIENPGSGERWRAGYEEYYSKPDQYYHYNLHFEDGAEASANTGVTVKEDASGSKTYSHTLILVVPSRGVVNFTAPIGDTPAP